jgi:hypothetical protein
MRRVWLVVLIAVACTNHEQKLKERIEQREQAKKDLEKAAEDKRKAAIPKIEPAHLEPYWDDAAYLRVTTGKPCPEGLWSLFPKNPEHGAEKREELVAKMRAAKFVTNLRLSGGVNVLPYDARKKSLTVEVDGLVECVDELGSISLAWGKPARVLRPKGEQMEELSPQSVWRAKSVFLALPMSKADATQFIENKSALLEARLVFTLGKVLVDTHLQKAPGVAAEDGTAKDEEMDWGAGRLVNVELVGLRLSTDHEKVAVLEKRYKE